MFTHENDQVLRDGEVVGTLKDGVVTLAVPLAPVHKSRLKKELAEAGITVAGFAKAGEEPEETQETGKSAPSCPPEDPLQGDKTPAVVEWYRDHQPEKFKRKYTGRKTHLGTL